MNTGTTTTVDERIVEMRIDNEKFEAGAKKTISILESLDRSLNKIGSDNVDGFDNIEKSLDKVTDRFSAMGIVSDQIMRNLTNKAMELVGQLKNMSTMLTTQQIGAGWDKYAGKVEAVQTIMASTNNLVGEGLKWANQEEQLAGVTEQLQRLTWFADETSYSFSDMVSNVGKFTAAGRDLEESVTAMQGISTWAAISGGRPAEAGRAMYNLSQALGVGAVTAQDWKSIELANMATYEFKQQVIDTAEKLGTLRKVAEDTWEVTNPTTKNADTIVTVENFRNGLAQKWFNSDVLLSVLNRYGDFSQEVARVQEKFDYDSATYVLKDLKNYEKMLTGDKKATEELEASAKDLGITINDLKSDFDEMLKPEYDLGRRAFQAAQEAKTFQEAIDATRDAVSTKWMDVFELMFGNYLEAKELWTKMSEVMWNIFARPVDRLIEIIENAQGFFDSEGVAKPISEGVGQAAGSTEVLENRLAAVGKTMKDFNKALLKVADQGTLEAIRNFGSIEEALKGGAISLEQFKLALGELDDSYDPKKPMTLNRALNKAGKTVADFEKALHEAMDQKDVVRALEQYSSLEDAFRNGAISVDDFKRALNSLGIDSENVTEEVEQTVRTGVGNIAEMRELALEVLRGDHGSGAERIAWYESMGLDPEVMQAMVGDLIHLRRAWYDDDYLMEIMEMYWKAQNLSARLGYATFAEYLASCTGATEEYVYDMNNMANEADNIYASLFGSGVVDEVGNLISAGELFRNSLTNLLDALKNFGDAFDEAFLKVFGGNYKYEDQIYTMSDGFFTLTAAFYSFSEKILAFSKSDAFMNFMEAFFSIIRVIGKALGLVIKIGKIGLSLILKLLSPILNLATGIFEIIAASIDGVSRMIDELGIAKKIDKFGNDIAKTIAEPIRKINKLITAIVDAFKEGFEEGGFEEGLLYIGATLDAFFENSPVALTIIHALEKAFGLLATAISTVVSVAGGLFGGAVMAVIGIFSTIIDWISKLILWAKDSEIINAIWDSIAETFTKVGNVLKRVFGKGGYAEEGFKEGGFIGAFNAVVDSVERGVTRLVPGGEKIASIIETLRNVFKKKSTDENGVERMVDNTENELLSLEETFSGGFFANLIRGASGDDEAKEAVGEGVSGLVDSAWQGFLNALRNIRISDVIDALKLGVIADVLFKVGHGLNIINGLADNIADIPDRFNDMLEDLGQMFRSIAVNFQMTAIKQLGVGILLIAGSIWILSRIPAKQLEKASSTVMAIILLLTLLVKVLVGTSSNLFKNLAGLPALGLALIGLASTIGAIGTTVLILAAVAKFIGPSELWQAIGAIIAIITVIGILVHSLVKAVNSKGFNGWQIEVIGSMLSRMGLGLMGLALAIQMLLVPIVVFCGILKLARGKAGIGKFWMAIGAITSILIAIGAMVWLISQAMNGFTAEQIGQLGNFMLKVGAAMILMSTALVMLTSPILILAAAQKLLGFNVNGIVGAFRILGVIAGAIILLLGIFAGVMSNKKEAEIKAVGNYLLKFAVSLILISTAMAIMVKPIVAIAKLCDQINDLQVLKSLAIIVVMLGILSGLLALLGKVILKNNGSENATRLGEGLFKIAKSIMLLSLAALLLSVPIVLLSAAIVAFTRALGNMDDKQWGIFEKGLERLGKFWRPLMKFGAALAVVGLAATLTGTGILAMSLGILVFAATIGIIMLAFPKFMDMLVTLKDIDFRELWTSIRKVLLSFLLFGVVLAAILLSLNAVIGKLNNEAFKNIGTSFLDGIKKFASNMRNGVSNGFTKTIEFLKDPKNKEALLSALKTLIIIGASYVAGLLPTLADTIIGGLVDLLNAIATAIKNHAPGIVEALNNIVEALIEVAAGLIDGAFGTNLLDNLTESEEKLNKVKERIEQIGLVVASVKLAKPFISLIRKLTGAGGVVAAIGVTIEKVGGLTTIVGDPKSAGSLYRAVNDVKGAIEIFGETAVGKFASILGPVLLVAAAVWSLHEATKAANAEIAEMEKDTIEEHTGNRDASVEERMAIYEKELAIYRKLQEEYNKFLIAGGKDPAILDSDEAKAAKAALDEQFEDILEIYERTAKDIATVTGDNWQDIYDEMYYSGGDLSKIPSYQKYLDIISQTEVEATEATTDFVSGIRDARDAMAMLRTVDLSDYGKTMASISRMGDAELIAFARTVEQDLGQAWSNTTTEVQKTEEVTTEALTTTEEKVSALKNKLTDLGYTGETSLATIFKEIGKDGLQNIFDSVGIDLSDLVNLTGNEELKSQMESIGIDTGGFLDSGLGAGILSNLSEIFTSNETLKNLTLKDIWDRWGIESPSTVMRDEVGQYIPAGIGAGIEKYWYTAVNPLYVLMAEMLHAFNNVQAKFAEHGAQIVAGLVEGINTNLEAAVNAGTNIAAALESGFTDYLKIESPSKVFADLARYIPAGISQGIEGNQAEAIDSVVVLGDQLMNAIMQSMAMVSTVADDDFEFNPRIMPVVDMSNVDSAADSMNGLFGGTYGVSGGMSNAISKRMAAAERIASNMATTQTINNGDNITFNIYQQPGEDANALADAVLARMNTRLARRGVAFG